MRRYEPRTDFNKLLYEMLMDPHKVTYSVAFDAFEEFSKVEFRNHDQGHLVYFNDFERHSPDVLRIMNLPHRIVGSEAIIFQL